MASRELRDRDWKPRGSRRRVCCLSLSALDSEIDLHPFVVLLQDAVVFAERVPRPAAGQKNAPQVRMALELDAKHVVTFALEPVSGCPNGDARRHRSAV